MQTPANLGLATLAGLGCWPSIRALCLAPAGDEPRAAEYSLSRCCGNAASRPESDSSVCVPLRCGPGFQDLCSVGRAVETLHWLLALVLSSCTRVFCGKEQPTGVVGHVGRVVSFCGDTRIWCFPWVR